MSKPIQSVERAMRMLEYLARCDGSAPLGAIADAAGVRSSTAHNILATLVALGYVQRAAVGSDYRLGGQILNLSRIAGNDDVLRRRMRPLLREIADRFAESVYLIVPSGNELYYLDGIEHPNNPTPQSRLGLREALSGSAVGLVLGAFMPAVRHGLLAASDDASLAERLDAVRACGFASECGLYQPGLHCVAVPVRLGADVRGGLCLNGAASRLPPDRLTAIAGAMADMALSAPG